MTKRKHNLTWLEQILDDVYVEYNVPSCQIAQNSAHRLAFCAKVIARVTNLTPDEITQHLVRQRKANRLSTLRKS